jgi:hypothetical protein
MRNLTTALIFALVVLSGIAMAQTNNNPLQATGSVWMDLFGGPQGTVIYPQYVWSLKTSVGNLGGYGFVEVAPHELFFTNHLVVYTPTRIPQFSVHTETGGIPGKSLGFFQVAPRLNIHETIPILKRPLHHLFVAALPRFIGIRPNNLLIAGATNRFKIVPGVLASVEGYRRFFGGGRPDYGEYWFMVHPKKTGHLSFGAFLLQDGSRTSLNAGIRISQ